MPDQKNSKQKNPRKSRDFKEEIENMKLGIVIN